MSDHSDYNEDKIFASAKLNQNVTNNLHLDTRNVKKLTALVEMSCIRLDDEPLSQHRSDTTLDDVRCDLQVSLQADPNTSLCRCD